MSLTPKKITHEKLLQIVQTWPDDYTPGANMIAMQLTSRGVLIVLAGASFTRFSKVGLELIGVCAPTQSPTALDC